MQPPEIPSLRDLAESDQGGFRRFARDFYALHRRGRTQAQAFSTASQHWARYLDRATRLNKVVSPDPYDTAGIRRRALFFSVYMLWFFVRPPEPRNCLRCCGWQQDEPMDALGDAVFAGLFGEDAALAALVDPDPGLLPAATLEEAEVVRQLMVCHRGVQREPLLNWVRGLLSRVRPLAEAGTITADEVEQAARELKPDLARIVDPGPDHGPEGPGRGPTGPSGGIGF